MAPKKPAPGKPKPQGGGGGGAAPLTDASGASTVRKAAEGYPAAASAELARPFTRGTAARLLPSWGTPVTHEEKAPSGALTRAFPDANWVEATDVWPEPTTVRLVAPSETRHSVCVADLFRSCSWRPELAEYASFLNLAAWAADSVPPGQFLWEAIAPAQPDSDQGTDQQQVWVVKLFVAGEERQIVVDSKVPLDPTTGQPMCAIFDSAANKPEHKHKGEVEAGDGGAADSSVAEEGHGDPQIEERFVDLWPMLLQKALLELQNDDSFLGVIAQHPFFALFQWVCLGETVVTDMDVLFPTARNQPCIEWEHSVEPRKDDFFFSSWEHFALAKSEAAGSEDSNLLEIFDKCEKEAIERRMAFEIAEAEAAQAATAEAEADDGNAAGVLVTKQKEPKTSRNKGKKKKKKGRRESEFVPFNQISYDVAMDRYHAARAAAVARLSGSIRQLEVVHVQSNRPVKMRCKVVPAEVLNVKPLNDAAQEAASAVAEKTPAGKGAPKGKGGAPPPAPVATSPVAKRGAEYFGQLVEAMSTADWHTGSYYFLPGSLFAVAEVCDDQVRLVGIVAKAEEGVLTPAWGMSANFWIRISELASISDKSKLDANLFQRSWKIESVPTLRANLAAHWDWAIPADPQQQQAIQGGGEQPNGIDEALAPEARLALQPAWTQRSVGHCQALLLRTAEKEASPEDALQAEDAVAVTIEVACDPAASKHASRCVLQWVPLEATGDIFDNHMDAVRESGSGSELICRTDQGVAAEQVRLRKDVVYALIFDAPQGGTVAVRAQSDCGAEVTIEPILTQLQVCSSQPVQKHDFHYDFESTASGDWRIISRHRVVPAEEGAQIVGSLCFSDSILHQYTRVIAVDNASGKTTRIDSGPKAHNGQWIPTFVCPTPGQTMDILVVMDAARHVGLCGGDIDLSFASKAGAIKSIEQVELAPRQLFIGDCRPNNNCFLFRDYIQPVPDHLSLALTIREDPPPFRLMVVIQNCEAQSKSCTIGAGDEIVAEITSQQCSRGGASAEIHWVPPPCLDMDGSTRVILQAVVDLDSARNRQPYWEDEQVPSDTATADAAAEPGQTEEAEKAEPAPSKTVKSSPPLWELRAVCSGSDGLVLARETAWEGAILARHQEWESKQPNRRELGLKVRTEHLAWSRGEEVPVTTTENQGTPTNAKAGGGGSAPASNSPLRRDQRAKARTLFRSLCELDGRVLIPRCPVPKSIDERDCLDACVKLEGWGDAEETDRVVNESVRAERLASFQALMANLKEEHAAIFTRLSG